MPEAPEEIYERAAGNLRMPPVSEWETFPFDGEMTPRKLLPPTEEDRPRHGAGGIDCRRCLATDDRYLWTDSNWRLFAPSSPTGLPVVVLLEPRMHFGEPGDLPDELAREMGVMLGKVERAVRSVGEIGRVHVCRWGDGSEHLHWWFMARPARLPQLIGSFAAVWDEVLPPTPQHIWDGNLEAVVRSLSQTAST